MNALTEEGKINHAGVQTEKEWIETIEFYLGKDPWGWAGPSTWCTMFSDHELGLPQRLGERGHFYFIVADAKVFMNPWADEGFLSIKNLPFANL